MIACDINLQTVCQQLSQTELCNCFNTLLLCSYVQRCGRFMNRKLTILNNNLTKSPVLSFSLSPSIAVLPFRHHFACILPPSSFYHFTFRKCLMSTLLCCRVHLLPLDLINSRFKHWTRKKINWMHSANKVSKM